MAKLKNRHKHKGFRFSVTVFSDKIVPKIVTVSICFYNRHNTFEKTMNTVLLIWTAVLAVPLMAEGLCTMEAYDSYLSLYPMKCTNDCDEYKT